MELKTGCMSFCAVFKVPNAETVVVDAFLDKHEAFMRATHSIDGGKEPSVIGYHVARSAEAKDPMDPSKGVTDFTMYSLVETYRGVAGCQAHMAIAPKWPDMFQDFQSCFGKYTVVPMMFCPVVATHSDPLRNVNKDINTDCVCFHVYFKVPNKDTAWMDQFVSEHETFVRNTHPASGDTEPRVLYYAWHKLPEQKNPMDPSAGVTDFTLYNIIEVYRGMEGCQKHMEVAQTYPDTFGKFQKAMADFCVYPGMMLPVVKCRGAKASGPGLNLGDVVPDFAADSSVGPIPSFHQWMAKPPGSWTVLFSHPADFTPVCTTELGTVALIQEEFTKRDCKVIALSCDDVASHEGWIKDICDIRKVASFGFPIIADPSRELAVAFGMVDPDEKDAAGLPMTCRAVFVIGPDRKLKLSMLYPASTGRNFSEILRVLDSLQLTAKHSVATPADWSSGEDCMVLPSIDAATAAAKFPQHRVLPTPSGKQYLRVTPQPK